MLATTKTARSDQKMPVLKYYIPSTYLNLILKFKHMDLYMAELLFFLVRILA
jgi:hypothetical protein